MSENGNKSKRVPWRFPWGMQGNVGAQWLKYIRGQAKNAINADLSLTTMQYSIIPTIFISEYSAHNFLDEQFIVFMYQMNQSSQKCPLEFSTL